MHLRFTLLALSGLTTLVASAPVAAPKANVQVDIAAIRSEPGHYIHKRENALLLERDGDSGNANEDDVPVKFEGDYVNA